MSFSSSVNPVRSDGWMGSQQLTSGVRDSDDPSIPDPPYWAMQPRWEVVRACLEGTAYLRRNAARYLPQQPMELDDSYQGRVDRSVFSPFFQRVARTAVGLILRKPIYLDGGDETFWEEWSTDVDRQGTSLNEFARNQLMNSVCYGHSSWLVDFPDTKDIRTLKDQTDAKLQPYFVPTDIWNIIGWRQDPRENAGRLQQVRIREVAAKVKGKFGQEYKNRVRVLERGKWELYEAKGELGSTDWEIIGSGRTSVSEIPLVTTYSNKLGPLFSDPLLEEIAQLNLTYYQRHADLIQALHIAAQPIMVLKGWDDQSDPIGLSVNNALALPPEGDAKYVEPASSAFDAQRAELDLIEEQISSLGIAVLSKQKSQAESGLSKALDRADSNAMLSVISKDLEKALQQAVDIAAEYAGTEPPTVVIDRDFVSEPLDGQGITAINTIYSSGLIDHETALTLLKRGEILQDDADIETILAGTEADELHSLDMQVKSVEAMQEVTPDEPTSDDEESAKPPAEKPRK